MLFISAASNVVPFDGNGAQDVFRYDRVTNTTLPVSTPPDGSRTDVFVTTIGVNTGTGANVLVNVIDPTSGATRCSGGVVGRWPQKEPQRRQLRGREPGGG